MKKYNTMAELAADLGVSRSTVSYILNGKWMERNISRETVKRVTEYAQQVNFVPNLFGRAIKGKVCFDAAILLPHNAYMHHQEAFFKLLTHLSETNLKYLVLPMSKEPDVTALLEQLTAYNVQRIVVVASPLWAKSQPLFLDRLIGATNQTQWLLYDCPDDELCGELLAQPQVGFVGFERQKAIGAICDYVKSHGYRSLATFGLPPRLFKGYGLNILPILVQEENPSSNAVNSGIAVAEALLRQFSTSSNPQAVFINDDLQTIHTIIALQKLGFQVPENFAFVSWDGLDVSRYFSRSLATLVIPHAQMLECAENFLTGNLSLPRLRLPAKIRDGESFPYNNSL